MDGEAAYSNADFIVIAAPTNYDPAKNFFDTSAVESVIELVLKVKPNAVIISLTSKVQNRRLWNYYTDGMKGFALDYRVDDLVKALKAMGAKSTVSRRVTYGDEKLELSYMIDEVHSAFEPRYLAYGWISTGFS